MMMVDRNVGKTCGAAVARSLRDSSSTTVSVADESGSVAGRGGSHTLGRRRAF